jgi:flagellar basal-body rod modification protein FlgD
MSRVNSLLASNPTPAASQPVNDLKDLDINQFLQLMISELTNQDPLNPLDNTQLVQQLGHLREIAATTQLTDTLASLQVGQSLTTASSLLGKKVTALSTNNQNITGVVDRVSVEVDPNDQDKRSYRVHIGNQSVDLKNVREVNDQ